MIWAGKSTLSRALDKEIDADIVFEVNEKDELQNLLLKKLYEGVKTSAIAFQVYLFCSRFDIHKNLTLNQFLILILNT